MRDLDMGIMVEGIVELDPMSGRMVLRYQDAKGENQFLDIQERLASYKGEEVRCIVTPMSTVSKLATLVSQGAVKAENIPKVPKVV